MEQQDDEIVSQEPQLTYWNPSHRRCRSVYPGSSVPVTGAPFNSIPVPVKLGAQIPLICDSSTYPSTVNSNMYENPITFVQDNPHQKIYGMTSDICLPSMNGDSTLTNLNTLSQLDYPVLPAFPVTSQDGQIIKQEPEEDLRENFDQEIRDEIITFSSINEALDTIDPPSTPESNRSTSSTTNGRRMGLTHEKHEEVVKAAKSLFSKRTRTLYHWLFPDTSKNKLKATVSAAWDTLSEGEKHFYISQVLGRFGLQASSLMVNPQLGGMKGLPNDIENKIDKKKNGPVEDQQAVDSLFNSCADAGNWTSYSEPKVKKPKKDKTKRKRRKRRKEESDDEKDQDPLSSDPEIEQAAKVAKGLKKLKKIQKDLDADDFEEDPELTRELEKFRLITEAAEEDIWDDIPDPEELFAEIGF